MELLQINGKSSLYGEIDVHGAKNSVLPILASCVLIKGKSVIHNCPSLSDVDVTLKILKHLGADIYRNSNTVYVDTTEIVNNSIPSELMQELRSSIIFLGALLSRCDSACVYIPGGCDIGLRPIDLHINGLKNLGYDISFDGNNICGCCQNKQATEIVLPFASVGATENIILGSVFTKGTTTIVNAAKEPEIVDLVNFLNSAGAKIKGASTPMIVIEGVEKLKSTEYTVMPDRILATTFMCASAITNSPLKINKICISDLSPVLPVFDEMGCAITLDKNSLKLTPPKRVKRIKFIQTSPYPGFPTDCQAPIMSVLCLAKGTSVINETIFESRYKHVSQLNRFGTDIIVKDRSAIINGVKNIHCADAVCTDLRGGIALVLIAMAAEGVSKISSIEHIDRGYENIEKQLSSIGVKITRVLYEESKPKK